MNKENGTQWYNNKKDTNTQETWDKYRKKMHQKKNRQI